MNKLLLALLAGTSLMCLASCETYDHDDDDDDHPRRSVMTTTEETTVSSPTAIVPVSGAVQTTRTVTY
ncbi:hypothetical protein [Brevifollis gellanilyticus]|uniref:hypothetical protein n=1 Tax=Brevifollis gellanilyticus TaxID=748831 RepID=UPI0011BF9C78|nr:hypothetical protein [Brevifollis gellanilyticus]